MTRSVCCDDFERDGYSVHNGVLGDSMRADSLRNRVVAEFDALQGKRHGAGLRSGLTQPAIAALVRTPAVRALVEPILGRGVFAFRATLFDKTDVSNWPVAWHQDRLVPVAEPRSVQAMAQGTAQGFAPWSEKPDGWYVEPPIRVQERIVAVRIDVDGSGPHNGGLRMVPGTHLDGVLSSAQITTAVADGDEVCPSVVAGGAMRMRPLLLHSSRRIHACDQSPLVHRRIVHFEFYSGALPAGVQFVRRVACIGE